MMTRHPKAKEACVCCGKSGHATLLWHWRHGRWCVLCVSEAMDMLCDFLMANPKYDTPQKAAESLASEMLARHEKRSVVP